MNKEFVPYEEALTLKELGFDENCFGFYGAKELWVKLTDRNKIADSNVLAPLYQQAFRWFREEHNISGDLIWDTMHGNWDVVIHNMDTYEDFEELDYLSSPKTYEEAELACLRKLIEIVKNK